MTDNEEESQSDWHPPTSDAPPAEWHPPTSDAPPVAGAPPPAAAPSTGWHPPASDKPPVGWTPPGQPTNNDALKTEIEKLPGPDQMPPWSSYLPAVGATAATAGLTLAGLGVATGPPGWIALALAGGLGAAAGSLAKQAIEQGGVPKNAGDALSETGIDAVTQGIAPELIGSATGSLLGRFLDPVRQYKIALRPSGSAMEADKAVQAGLKGKIQLGWDTPAAMAKNEARGDALNAQIDNAIKGIPGGALPAQQWTANVQSKLDAVRGQWMMDPLNRRANLAQIDEAEKAFILNHGNLQPIQRQVTINGKSSTITVPPEDMTLQEMRANAQPLPLTRAQAIKQASYVTTRSNKIAAPAAFNPMVQPGLDVEARGAITSALREDLENYPGLEKLKQLNQDSGESQALNQALEKFSRRLPSVKLLVNALGGAGGGFLMGHTPESIAYGAGVGVLKYALEDPLVRSRLAIALYGVQSKPALAAAAGLAGRAAVRLPIMAGKIMVDAEKAKQGPQEPPQQAGGGKAKSDDYLQKLERRAYSRKATLNGLLRR